MELVCPAGNLPSLKAAVDNGADAVYIGFRDATNARHFAGLNFNDRQAHVLPEHLPRATTILADIGVLDYAAERWPDVDRHLSVQGSATTQEAIAFYADHFGIRRAVLPRVLSVKQVEAVASKSPVSADQRSRPSALAPGRSVEWTGARPRMRSRSGPSTLLSMRA